MWQIESGKVCACTLRGFDQRKEDVIEMRQCKAQIQGAEYKQRQNRGRGYGGKLQKTVETGEQRVLKYLYGC